jgi:threonyl-tRNA synthetase
MIELIFPDGSKRAFDKGSSGRDVAASIAKSLEKRALLVRLDGQLLDLDRPLPGGGTFEILTRESPHALEVIRHDASHVLAQAVQELFPGTQVTIGPAIEDGFYYDFARDTPFTPDDLPKIEARMHEIVKAALPTRREVWPRDKAVAHFQEMGEKYKAELIASIPSNEDVSLYWHGDWHDLCRGPHFRTTSEIGDAFKLTKISGAYWRGDAKNAQLQRIYGTAWRDKKELDAYVTRMEEAEKRDHRKIGKEMDLFHTQEVATGQIFWHANGYTLYRALENYIRRQLVRADYIEVKTPQLLDRKLWEASGHWDNYRDHMFIAEVEDEARTLVVKPMNCPAHVQIFNEGLKSYRELPIRMAEFGSCHRYEPSGSLHGIMRVRGFVQDDAHIFCTHEQITPETTSFCKLLLACYKDLGFEEVRVKLATRPENRIGSDAVWDQAEKALAEATSAAGLDYVLNPGEGAFYGPKLEFVLRDSIGRDWQCGTLQVDFNTAERLGAAYIAQDGNRHAPVMLHRAIVGSLERFIGVLIEHFAGKFPLWLAPVQVTVATVVADADSYAHEVVQALKAAGLRVTLDTENQTVNYKVRQHSLAKTPNLLVLGRREAENRTVTLRKLGVEKQESLALEAAISMLAAEAVPPDLR